MMCMGGVCRRGERRKEEREGECTCAWEEGKEKGASGDA